MHLLQLLATLCSPTMLHQHAHRHPLQRIPYRHPSFLTQVHPARHPRAYRISPPAPFPLQAHFSLISAHRAQQHNWRLMRRAQESKITPWASWLGEAVFQRSEKRLCAPAERFLPVRLSREMTCQTRRGRWKSLRRKSRHGRTCPHIHRFFRSSTCTERQARRFCSLRIFQAGHCWTCSTEKADQTRLRGNGSLVSLPLYPPCTRASPGFQADYCTAISSWTTFWWIIKVKSWSATFTWRKWWAGRKIDQQQSRRRLR